MKLSHTLQKNNNNIDIFRVIAAFMVIYGHAYALIPTEGRRDIVGSLLIFDYSGSLAVKIFFFLSGLVVTNSLLEKKNICHFIVSRIFRIWPALILVVAIWAFIIGPILSINSPREYFANPAVIKYFFHNLFLDMQYNLPGVFQENIRKDINGSPWSIPFEVYAYIVLLAVFLLKLDRHKHVTAILFLIIVVDSIVGNKILFTWLPINPEVTLLAPCFTFGSLLALYKDKIEIDYSGIAGLWLLWYLFRSSEYSHYFFYTSLFCSIIFASSREWLLKFKPNIDISYGVYLWGWPVQQVLAQQFPTYGIGFNQVFAIIISAIFGYVSWSLIEHRFIAIGANLVQRVSPPKIFCKSLPRTEF